MTEWYRGEWYRREWYRREWYRQGGVVQVGVLQPGVVQADGSVQGEVPRGLAPACGCPDCRPAGQTVQLPS